MKNEEIKKLYFSGVSGFSTLLTILVVSGQSTVLIEEKWEAYFLVGMTLIASFIGAAVTSFFCHLFSSLKHLKKQEAQRI